MFLLYALFLCTNYYVLVACTSCMYQFYVVLLSTSSMYWVIVLLVCSNCMN